MNDRSEPVALAGPDPAALSADPLATAPAAAAPLATDAAVPAPAQPAIDTALEIAQLCQLAGRPELIVGYLQAAASTEQVRNQLLQAQVEATARAVADRLGVDCHIDAIIPAIRRLQVRAEDADAAAAALTEVGVPPGRDMTLADAIRTLADTPRRHSRPRRVRRVRPGAATARGGDRRGG